MARSTSPEIREILFDLSVGLTKQKALIAPKVRDLTRAYDEKTVVKLMVMILRASVESFRVSQQPDAIDLMELALDLVHMYPCDSLEDFVLALKNVRTRGVKTYNSLDSSKFHGFFNTYFEEKSIFLENRHRDHKATGPGRDAAVVAAVAAAPHVAAIIQRQLDPAHPNHGRLRLKLNITAAKEDRGLITPEEAAAQRAEVELANYRHATRRQKP